MVKLDLARTRRGLVLAGVAAAALASGGCTALDDALAKVPFFSFMTHSPAFDPYEAPRPAPPNTVPFESPLNAPLEPPLPATDAALRAFGDTLKNPFPKSEEVLAAGAAAYQTHCFVCHGPAGEGNGPATGLNRFPLGPSLMTPSARGLSDGYIFGLIRVGRGLMPAYGGRIPYAERWYIVNYVRQLQQQAPGGAPAATQPAAPGRE